ncbi:MAG TPA: transglutaminaseTgpA domain-containing protein [Chloroflexota bacterium]|nr:transglutaminaseTgpA domain-containing protein [Chloroflexota bacterium]
MSRLVPEGWLAIAGFTMAAEGLAGSVVSAHYQPGLGQLPWLLGLAVALGFVFTRGRGGSWLLHWVALVIGLLVAARISGTGFLPRNVPWQQAMYKVLADLSDWITQSWNGQITQDNLLISVSIASFLFIWVYTAFLVAIRFRAAWWAASMLAAAIFANVLLRPEAGAGWLALWAAGAGLLILQTNVTHTEQLYRGALRAGWQAGSRWSFGGGLVIAALATGAFAAAPPVQLNNTLNNLYQLLNGPIGQAKQFYNTIGVPQQVDASQVRFDTYQQQLRFLGPFQPGDGLVMKVKTDQARYEQGLVFDRYDHNGWTDTKFSQFEFSSDDFSTTTGVQQTAQDKDRVQITQQVTMVSPKGALLFAPPQPVGANTKLRGDGFGNLRATQIVQPNETYTSTSLESHAAAETLAAANGPIPDDVRSTFLELPPDLPVRVKQLALQKTAGKATAFDKATALEAFIRQNYPYDTQIPPPPADRDGVDWFLFEERRGYCDYDASAMAVMLRTLGIPSRVAAGYSPGQLDSGDDTYHVTEQDTHTWVQAYFPGYGWIDFEPSPSDPALTRPQQDSAALGSAAEQPLPDEAAQQNPDPSPDAGNDPTPGVGVRLMSVLGIPWVWLALLLFVLAGGGTYLYVVLRGSPGVALAYARIGLVGSLTGLRQRGWQTPAEYGRELHQRRGLDAGATETITALYGAHRFGPKGADDHANHRAWVAWRFIKGRLLRPRRRAV